MTHPVDTRLQPKIRPKPRPTPKSELPFCPEEKDTADISRIGFLRKKKSMNDITCRPRPGSKPLPMFSPIPNPFSPGFDPTRKPTRKIAQPSTELPPCDDTNIELGIPGLTCIDSENKIELIPELNTKQNSKLPLCDELAIELQIPGLTCTQIDSNPEPSLEPNPIQDTQLPPCNDTNKELGIPGLTCKETESELK